MSNLSTTQFRNLITRLAGLEAALVRTPGCNAARLDYWVKAAEIRYDAAMEKQNLAAAADGHVIMSQIPFIDPALAGFSAPAQKTD